MCLGQLVSSRAILEKLSGHRRPRDDRWVGACADREGKMRMRSSHAAGRLGRLSRMPRRARWISNRACSHDHDTKGRALLGTARVEVLASARPRPDTSTPGRRLGRALIFSRRFRRPPRVAIATPETMAKALLIRLSRWK